MAGNDQYVDNRTTVAPPMQDFRPEGVKYMDELGRRQALVDVSGMFTGLGGGVLSKALSASKVARPAVAASKPVVLNMDEQIARATRNARAQRREYERKNLERYRAEKPARDKANAFHSKREKSERIAGNAKTARDAEKAEFKAKKEWEAKNTSSGGTGRYENYSKDDLDLLHKTYGGRMGYNSLDYTSGYRY